MTDAYTAYGYATNETPLSPIASCRSGQEHIRTGTVLQKLSDGFQTLVRTSPTASVATSSIQPSQVVIMCLTGDSILFPRAEMAWRTWLSTARDLGFQTVVIAQSNRTTPFPVIGIGGREAAGSPDMRKHGMNSLLWYTRATLDNIFDAFGAVRSRFPQHQWILKVDDDAFVHARNLWSMLNRMPSHIYQPNKPRPKWIIGDCGSYCGGGSGQVWSGAALDDLRSKRKACIDVEIHRATEHYKVASDSATCFCALNMHGNNTVTSTPASSSSTTDAVAQLINHEGFYPWPPRMLNSTSSSSKSIVTKETDRIGNCSARLLHPFVVAEDWITYHHVSPSMMQLLHEAVEREAHEQQPSQADGRESCAHPLAWASWQSGSSIHRCRGLLCAGSKL